jgi:glycosyltransferase involved in cell wall biosynthesis
MAASLPILSTSVGGIPDLIKEGVTGLLVKPAEMDKMAQHIFSLLGSDSIATEMGLRSREIAKKYYSPECIAQKHLKIYSDLAGNSFFK